MQRRQFLQAAGAAGAWSLSARAAIVRPKRSCILLMLTGGPSQLDTWDMKPDATSEVRGPFRPIKTNVAGIEISEIFPRMARQADKYSLIRSVWQEEPPLHEAGEYIMQTGKRPGNDMEHPPVGCVFSTFTGSRHVMLPSLMPVTDLHGEPESLRVRYGWNAFGQNCLRARRLVETGTSFVTVNMFGSVFDETTWDIHGYAPFSPISCYRDYVGPMFDAAYSSLLEDLTRRGLLETTLVIAMGEFGRTPKINPAGGRDHWPRCSTIVMAGGGIRGGRVYGSSDKWSAEPKDNPVTPAMVAATIYTALGVPLELELKEPGGISLPVVEAGAPPIWDLLMLRETRIISGTQR